MKLQIQLKKGRNKPDTLHCIRLDGSATWAKVHPGLVIHDLAHFAVEQVLGITDAFYGMIAAGYNISDFDLPRKDRPIELLPANLPEDSLIVEHIVNLLQVEFNNEEKSSDFMLILKDILDQNRLPLPVSLSESKLDEIRCMLKELMKFWLQLAPGEHLDLAFGEIPNKKCS